MTGNLNSTKSDSTAILAISVTGGGIIIGLIFLPEGGLFLAVFAALALCGILWWVSISHQNRAKDNGTKGFVLEIVGKPGIVIRECSLEGKVRIGDVTWSAISYDGSPLRVGEKVTVQDTRELKLAVKAKPSAMSLNH
jgi:membrane protein implicated in regulation of membrane protease activity